LVLERSANARNVSYANLFVLGLVGRGRFELPTMRPSRFPRVRHLENLGLFKIEDAMKAFELFCKVDLRLSDRTLTNNRYGMLRFFKVVSKDLRLVASQDVREYLARYKDSPANTYANVLKPLKVFFRDFLGMPEVVESFRFPVRPLHPRTVPSREEIQRFYEALDEPVVKAMFLTFASSGLRKNEVLSLRVSDIDLDRREIIPSKGYNGFKNAWVTFVNEETARVLKEHIASLNASSETHLFSQCEPDLRRDFKHAFKKTRIHITPQILREWFACEMGRLGVPDRYVDAFCGRVPRSVLARHYTDFSPERLKEVYDKAGLKVLH